MVNLILLVFTFSFIYVHGEDTIVQISNGKVKAEIMVNRNNRSFYAFRGIPYAKPPLGELRFQPPQKPDNWEGVLEDTARDRWCIQLTPDLFVTEQEDCLYLHVYTPKVPTEKENVSLPVLYNIHGGAFVTGAPTVGIFGPHYLMDEEIIVVSVGYRLGFLGFLSTGDLNCPGNNGLKDQQFGLRWVQENIHKFGGDPNRVTIFGESAGAASVSYHLLAPKSAGLFSGAIQDSGTSMNAWGLQKNPKNIAYTFAKYFNSTITEDNTSSLDLLSFFRTLDVQQIKKACMEVFRGGFVGTDFSALFGFAFVGTMEPEHEDAFLTKPPYEQFKNGDFNVVPTMLGVNSEECLFLHNDISLRDRMVYLDDNPEYYALPDMHIPDLETRQLVGQKIREIYDSSGSLHQSEGLSIKYYSDTTFIRAALKQAELQSKYTDVYFYEFAYYGEMGSSLHVDIPGADKITHGEEMMYLFLNIDWKDINTCPEQDRLTMRRMLTMWTNFVKYQNPTPEPLELLGVMWPKIQSLDKMPYLVINNTLEVKYNYKKEMMDAYRKLYDTYGVPPLDAY